MEKPLELFTAGIFLGLGYTVVAFGAWMIFWFF